jgi:hypothetical protein
MIPILTILVAIIGLLGIVAGIIFFVLRRRGERIGFSPDQEQTQKLLRKAFGKNTKWGGAGGTESEMHDFSSDSGSGDGGSD